MKLAILHPENTDIGHFKDLRKEIPPFGVLYLAAISEAEGVETTIIKITPNDISFDLREFDIVAFSILSSINYSLAKRVRFSSSYSPKALILVGGIHTSIFPEHVLLDMQADIVSYGPGELIFQQVIREYPNINKENISGICFKQNNTIVKTEQVVLDKDLNWLPIPARHLIDESDLIMNRLADTKLRMTYIMASRGCPFKCKFCSVMQKKVQYRSGQHIRQELEHLIENYKIGGFAFVDDHFTANHKNVSEICNVISDLSLKWSALCRIDSINSEILKKMREGGCIEIKLGLETGSNLLLKSMGKKISSEMTSQVISLAAQTGMQVKLFLLHGFPGENMKTTEETIKLLSSLRSSITRVSLTRFVPLPGSYVFDHPKEFNLHIENELKGNYERCYMYNNHNHWWGTKDDFEELNHSYSELVTFFKSENLFET